MDGRIPSSIHTKNPERVLYIAMGQSLVKNYIHIVFSTKHRAELIHPPYEQELHAYLGGVCNELECPVLIAGGYKDHVHVLCMLSKK